MKMVALLGMAVFVDGCIENENSDNVCDIRSLFSWNNAFCVCAFVSE